MFSGPVRLPATGGQANPGGDGHGPRTAPGGRASRERGTRQYYPAGTPDKINSHILIHIF